MAPGIEQRRASSSPPGGRPAAESRAASLIRGIEVLIGRLADPDLPVSLIELERYERALHEGHRSNLLRLSVVEERLLAQPDEVHD